MWKDSQVFDAYEIKIKISMNRGPHGFYILQKKNDIYD